MSPQAQSKGTAARPPIFKESLRKTHSATPSDFMDSDNSLPLPAAFSKKESLKLPFASDKKKWITLNNKLDPFLNVNFLSLSKIRSLWRNLLKRYRNLYIILFWKSVGSKKNHVHIFQKGKGKRKKGISVVLTIN